MSPGRAFGRSRQTLTTIGFNWGPIHINSLVIGDHVDGRLTVHNIGSSSALFYGENDVTSAPISRNPDAAAHQQVTASDRKVAMVRGQRAAGFPDRLGHPAGRRHLPGPHRDRHAADRAHQDRAGDQPVGAGDSRCAPGGTHRLAAARATSATAGAAGGRASSCVPPSAHRSLTPSSVGAGARSRARPNHDRQRAASRVGDQATERDDRGRHRPDRVGFICLANSGRQPAFGSGARQRGRDAPADVLPRGNLSVAQMVVLESHHRGRRVLRARDLEAVGRATAIRPDVMRDLHAGDDIARRRTP